MIEAKVEYIMCQEHRGENDRENERKLEVSRARRRYFIHTTYHISFPWTL